MTTPAMKMKTMADVISELETLLAWAKANPELPAMVHVEASWHFNNQKDLAAAFVRAVPKTEKDASGSNMWLKHWLTPIVELTAFVNRDAVCERVVVGTREVPETVTPAHTEEIVEWKCGSILAPSEMAAALTRNQAYNGPEGVMAEYGDYDPRHYSGDERDQT